MRVIQTRRQATEYRRWENKRDVLYSIAALVVLGIVILLGFLGAP